MNYVVADLETTPSGELSFGGFKYLEKDKIYYFTDLYQFINYIDNGSFIIYFHNFSKFDGVYVLDHLVKNAKFVTKFTRKVNEFQTIYTETGNIVNVKFRKNKKTRIEFRCTKLLWAESLKTIGETLNLHVKKGEVDYKLFKDYKDIADIPREFLDYLDNDIMLLDGLVKFFLKDVEKDKLPALTQASMSLKRFKEHIGTDNYNYFFLNKLKPDEWDFIKSAFFGGFSYVNPVFQQYLIKKTLYYYDENSSYPSILLNYKVPYGKPKSEPPSGHYTYWERRLIYSFKIKDNVHEVPYIHGEERKYNSTEYLKEGTLQTHTYNKDEWDYIDSIYDMEYEVVKIMYFKTAPIFHEYIKSVKSMKENAKTPVERSWAKIFLNSLYGKFAQNRVLQSKVWLGDKWDTVTTIKENNLHYIPVAAFITAQARLLLHRAIHEHKEHFVYCDTDSLVMFDKMDNKYLDPNEFGKWKLELVSKEAFFNKTKNYGIITKEGYDIVKLAGYRGGNELTFNQYLNTEEYLHLKKKRVDYGLKLELSPFINDIIIKGVINE